MALVVFVAAMLEMAILALGVLALVVSKSSATAPRMAARECADPRPASAAPRAPDAPPSPAQCAPRRARAGAHASRRAPRPPPPRGRTRRASPRSRRERD